MTSRYPARDVLADSIAACDAGIQTPRQYMCCSSGQGALPEHLCCATHNYDCSSAHIIQATQDWTTFIRYCCRRASACVYPPSISGSESSAAHSLASRLRARSFLHAAACCCGNREARTRFFLARSTVPHGPICCTMKLCGITESRQLTLVPSI